MPLFPSIMVVSLSIFFPAVALAGNSLSIQQVQNGRLAPQKDTAEEDLKKEVEKDEETRAPSNPPILLQQGKQDITDLTQQGRLNNVINSGSVLPQQNSNY